MLHDVLLGGSLLPQLIQPDRFQQPLLFCRLLLSLQEQKFFRFYVPNRLQIFLNVQSLQIFQHLSTLCQQHNFAGTGFLADKLYRKLPEGEMLLLSLQLLDLNFHALYDLQNLVYQSVRGNLLRKFFLRTANTVLPQLALVQMYIRVQLHRDCEREPRDLEPAYLDLEFLFFLWVLSHQLLKHILQLIVWLFPGVVREYRDALFHLLRFNFTLKVTVVRFTFDRFI
ncbi:MAG: hypothetical protein FD178_3450 [Ignavibacteria bacterium]|nr:MAG: hypothetical protein FD178_3450 [Ignavibacteria bacterium]